MGSIRSLAIATFATGALGLAGCYGYGTTGVAYSYPSGAIGVSAIYDPYAPYGIGWGYLPYEPYPRYGYRTQRYSPYVYQAPPAYRAPTPYVAPPAYGPAPPRIAPPAQHFAPPSYRLPPSAPPLRAPPAR